MKKVTLTGKLSLNKETIAKLNETQMNNVLGGQLPPYSNNPNAGCQTHPYCAITIGGCNGYPE